MALNSRIDCPIATLKAQTSTYNQALRSGCMQPAALSQALVTGITPGAENPSHRPYLPSNHVLVAAIPCSDRAQPPST